MTSQFSVYFTVIILDAYYLVLRYTYSMDNNTLTTNWTTVKAPGRINLIGEHTDYNLGLVLPASIDKYVTVKMAANGMENEFSAIAKDLNDQYNGQLDHLRLSTKSWANYLIGILDQLQKRGYHIRGFQCEINSNIPIGAGLSSSAALDCGLIKALSETFDLNLSNWDIAKISKASNNQFLGIQSGILDQFASVFGEKDTALKMDCRSLEYDKIPIHLGEYELVLINTNVKHQHTESGYNDRPSECQEIISIINSQTDLNLTSLRDLTMTQLHACRPFLSPTLYARAKFIIEENDRVESFVKAMQSNDIRHMGQLLYECHDGLSQEYEVSCPELDTLVDITRDIPDVAGARMMGGGFGGCTLNLINSSMVKKAVENILEKYQTVHGIKAEAYHVHIENGVHVLSVKTH